MINKKAELTSTMIISMVLILAGLVLLGYFIYQISFKQNVDSEACHESVVLRATVPDLTQGYVPLKCKTDKVCITSKFFGGNCSNDYGDLKGISYSRVSSAEEVDKTLALKVADCWSMMGEGKVSIFSQFVAQNFGVGKVYPSCVICSRVAYDSQNLDRSKIDLSESNLMNYMLTHKMPGTEDSYLNFLSGKVSVSDSANTEIKMSSIKTVNDSSGKTSEVLDPENPETVVELLNRDELTEEIKNQQSNQELQKKQTAIVFMQISSPKHGESILNILKGGVVAGGVVGPKNFIKVVRSGSQLCTKNPYIALGCGVVAALAGAYQQGSVAWNRALTAGYCGDISSGGEEREGCSVVRVVNYNEQELSQYCGVIESIP